MLRSTVSTMRAKPSQEETHCCHMRSSLYQTDTRKHPSQWQAPMTNNTKGYKYNKYAHCKMYLGVCCSAYVAARRICKHKKSKETIKQRIADIYIDMLCHDMMDIIWISYGYDHMTTK